MKVVFAPNETTAPYQPLLAKALSRHGVEVTAAHYRRGLPLYRSIIPLGADLVHFHYPEYYMIKDDHWDLLRKLRFFPDLYLTHRRLPFVLTVFSLVPNNSHVDWILKADIGYLLRACSALFVNTAGIRDQVLSCYRIDPAKLNLVPHGDMLPQYGELLPRELASERLGLSGEKICLSLGMIAPNKGQGELISFWRQERPEARLVLVGPIRDSALQQPLLDLASGVDNIEFHIGFQPDEQVRLWLSVADCVIINYKRIGVSGVAYLARASGIPVLLAAALTTIDLAEPHPSVFRFNSLETDFADQLVKALAYGCNFEAAAEWRRDNSFDVVAAKTKLVYDAVLGRHLNGPVSA